MAPEPTVVENPAGLQTPQQTPRRQTESSVLASPAQSGRFLKSPLAPFHSLMSLLSKIATNDGDKAGGSKNSVIYWDLFACAAGEGRSSTIAVILLELTICSTYRCHYRARQEDAGSPSHPASSYSSCVESRSRHQDQLCPGQPDGPDRPPTREPPRQDRKPDPAVVNRSQDSRKARKGPSASTWIRTARYPPSSGSRSRRARHPWQDLQPDAVHSAQGSGGSSRSPPHRSV